MKRYILLIMMIMLILTGCNNVSNEEISIIETETASGEVSITENASEEESITETDSGELQEAVVDIEEMNLEELSSDELLDLFIDGKIKAYYQEEDREPFYMTDLPSDPNDFTYCSIGDKEDLDNDGENELIINGAYGGIYLDARDGKVYVLDRGDGTAYVIGYTEFDGQTWIVHGDTTHGGRIMYFFILYDGMGNIVDEFNLHKEYWENPDDPDGSNTIYTYRDEQITKEEYDELRMKFLKY